MQIYKSYEDITLSGVPVVFGQLLPGNDAKFDVRQAWAERGREQGHGDLLLVPVNVLDTGFQPKHKRQSVVSTAVSTSTHGNTEVMEAADMCVAVN